MSADSGCSQGTARIWVTALFELGGAPGGSSETPRWPVADVRIATPRHDRSRRRPAPSPSSDLRVSATFRAISSLRRPRGQTMIAEALRSREATVTEREKVKDSADVGVVILSPAGIVRNPWRRYHPITVRGGKHERRGSTEDSSAWSPNVLPDGPDGPARPILHNPDCTERGRAPRNTVHIASQEPGTDAPLRPDLRRTATRRPTASRFPLIW